MGRIEGSYESINGCLFTQCSIWDIVTNREEKQIKKIIARISKKNNHKCIVNVVFSVEMEDKEHGNS